MENNQNIKNQNSNNEINEQNKFIHIFKSKKPNKFTTILLVLLMVLMVFYLFSLFSNNSNYLTVSEILTALEDDSSNNSKIEIQGNIIAIPAGGENAGIFTIKGRYKNIKDNKVYSFYSNITNLEYEYIRKYIDVANTNIQDEAKKINLILDTIKPNYLLSFILSFLPYILIGLLFFWFMKKQTGKGMGLDFGKSTAKLVQGKATKFSDVAGCDEEKLELIEIVDFLKNPKKYAEVGARLPKGVLLSGPPGTGKTLLAKSVAGEANVPFFSISGSDFLEMFVGVGASRVRDMFKTAKENAPCIIFIDEIDAIGRQRGAGMGGGHDEREQTLNQMLVEMDGFDSNSGIIIMAATNRPDVLDPALLRPGRFDRRIIVNAPDIKGREAILYVHSRNKKIDSSINFKNIAARTPGFSGADLENLLNEAALLAARDNRVLININDIDEAIDRVLMGPAKTGKEISQKQKEIVAYHEAGHAVIGLNLEDSNIVHKITIIPRGDAGGYNLMLPKEDEYLLTSTSLKEKITSYLGGRVAEEIIFGDVTTGAQNDFQMATRIARSMVTQFGMSELGPVQYEDGGNVFLGRDFLKEKNFSESISYQIDMEVKRIINECYEKAKNIINENRELLENIVKYLLEYETLTKEDIDQIKSTGTLIKEVYIPPVVNVETSNDTLIETDDYIIHTDKKNNENEDNEIIENNNDSEFKIDNEDNDIFDDNNDSKSEIENDNSNNEN